MEIESSTHNHIPTIASSHSSHHKLALTDEIQHKVSKQFRTGVRPNTTRDTLLLNEDEAYPVFKLHDIYNLHTKVRTKNLSSLTSIQSLILELEKHPR